MFFNKKRKEDKNIANDDRIKVDTTTITTMVGADTLIEGMLKTKSSIRINGTIIGDVRADGVVVLTKTGRIVGTIEAESIIVAGVVEGNMSIRDKVNVEATGEIYGDVITKKFVIDEESIFQGNCIMNRDGKIIPVPPYIKDSDKKAEEDKTEDKKEQKNADKSDKKDTADKADSDSKKKDVAENKDEKDSKNSTEKDGKNNKEKDKNSTEKDIETKEENKELKDEKASDKEYNEEKDNEDLETKDADDTLIIADINEIEAVDDIPASDGDIEENYVKKSKSLSVEIEN